MPHAHHGAALLALATCHDAPHVDEAIAASATASVSAARRTAAEERTGSAASSSASATARAPGDLSDIGEGGGIVRSGDPGFDRFAYGNDPRKPTGPVIRAGAVAVTGRLPPEVVIRIVRQSFRKIGLCYEPLLAKDPALSASVTARFTIDRSGSLKNAKTDGDLPQKNALLCIQRAFSTLSFPQPESGIVQVVFPLTFNPPAYKFMIGEKHSVHAREDDVVKASETAGYEVTGARATPRATGISRFQAEKDRVKLSITLDPDARLPLDAYRKLSKQAVTLEDGSWGLFIESSDKAAAQTLIDAIHQKLEQP